MMNDGSMSNYAKKTPSKAVFIVTTDKSNNMLQGEN